MRTDSFDIDTGDAYDGIDLEEIYIDELDAVLERIEQDCNHDG